MPVTGLSPSLTAPFPPLISRSLILSPSKIPQSKARLKIPLCMFHIPITPVELPTSPKLPQDVTNVDRAVPAPAPVSLVLALALSAGVDFDVDLDLESDSTEEGSLKVEEEVEGTE